MLSFMKQHKDLKFLITSVFISQLGTWFTYMLFVVQIFNQTKDERLTMIVVGAQMVAMLIGGQVAGIIIESKNPKTTLIASDWISAVIIAFVFFMPANVYVYSLFAFLMAFVNAFRMPTFQKYLVASVNEDDLMQANSSFQMIRELVKIIGPAMAVFVLALLPTSLKELGFVIDAVSYVIAACLLINLAVVKQPAGNDKAGSETDAHPTSWIDKWKGGLTPLKDPIVSHVFIIFLLLLFGIAGADVVLTSHVSEAGLNSYGVGYLIGALSLGLLLTAVLAAKHVKKWPLSIQLGVSSLLLGLSYSLIGFGSSLWTMMGAAFLTGIFNAIYNMSATTFWQKSVPYEQLGRFLSFSNSIFSIATLIGMLANAYISRIFSAGFDIMICGSIIAMGGLLLVINITLDERKKIA
ncbi:MAG TPA: MFS transporter, partial [Bacillales bacterium]|nr:MFS transporter [Bacillales bacterium]